MYYWNSCGLWCKECGAYLAGLKALDDRNYKPPVTCPNCEWPDVDSNSYRRNTTTHQR